MQASTKTTALAVTSTFVLSLCAFSPAVASAAPLPSCGASPYVASCIYTVPAGATFAKFVVKGAGGSSAASDIANQAPRGGNGAVVTAYQSVTPGWQITILVGRGFTDGLYPRLTFGGSASAVFMTGTFSIVAGGGGGGGSLSGKPHGGDGAALKTPAGGSSTDTKYGGRGGNRLGDGSGGAGGNNPTCGTPGIGGAGGTTFGPNGSDGVNFSGGGGGGAEGGDGGASGSFLGGDSLAFGSQSNQTGGGGAGFGAGGAGPAGGGGGYGGGGGNADCGSAGSGGGGGSYAPPAPREFPSPTFAPGTNGALGVLGPPRSSASTAGGDGSVAITLVTKAPRPGKPVVRWSLNKRKLLVTATINKAAWTTYKLTAKLGRKSRTGRCATRGTKVVCALAPGRGNWTFSVTPRNATGNGTPNQRALRL